MRIGIDTRMSGPAHAGIGRYVENLVGELSKNKDLELVLLKPNIPHYSLAEQFLVPGIIKKAQVDLMHFPHFNVPVFYTGKYVVTIHDLIKHVSRGMETTTRTPWLYWLKYLGYKFVFRQAVKRAAKILVPSQAVKDELAKTYNLPGDKIMVTYEGVGEKFQQSAISPPAGGQLTKISAKYNIKKPFVIYTGSLYPHKNVERLVKAVTCLNDSNHFNKPISLVVVCVRSVFLDRFQQKIKKMNEEKYVNLIGFVPDEDLVLLYQQAEAFVFPTLSEGFGLPGLEAMACGCPVVCSDIPVLREIYGEAAEYFDPLNPEDIAEKIGGVISDKKMRAGLIERGLEQVKKYSWSKMAQETLEVYKQFK